MFKRVIQGLPAQSAKKGNCHPGNSREALPRPSVNYPGSTSGPWIGVTPHISTLQLPYMGRNALSPQLRGTMLRQLLRHFPLSSLLLPLFRTPSHQHLPLKRWHRARPSLSAYKEAYLQIENDAGECPGLREPTS